MKAPTALPVATTFPPDTSIRTLVVVTERPEPTSVPRQRTSEVWQGIFACGWVVLVMAVVATVLRGRHKVEAERDETRYDDLERGRIASHGSAPKGAPRSTAEPSERVKA